MATVDSRLHPLALPPCESRKAGSSLEDVSYELRNESSRESVNIYTHVIYTHVIHTTQQVATLM